MSRALPMRAPIRTMPRAWANFWTPAIMATWTGWQTVPTGAPIRRACGSRQKRSVIMLGLNYGPDGDPLEILTRKDRAAISAYAQGDDYHDVVKKKLKALAGYIFQTHGAEVKVFVDTAPVMEKPLAQKAIPVWAGRESTPIWYRASSVPGCFWARSSPPSHCPSMRRNRIIAAIVMPAWTSARPRLSRRLTGWMRGAAFPISPSRTRAPSRANSAPPWAIESMAVTIAWRCVPGTSSPARPRKQSFRRGKSCRPLRWPSWRRWMMRRSAPCSVNRRSSASAATASSAM